MPPVYSLSKELTCPFDTLVYWIEEEFHFILQWEILETKKGTVNIQKQQQQQQNIFPLETKKGTVNIQQQQQKRDILRFYLYSQDCASKWSF